MTERLLIVHDGHSASVGASDLLASEVGEGCCVGREALPVENGVTFLRDLLLRYAEASPSTSLLFIVHCAPDGTCEKSVRKLTRALKLEADEPCTMNMIRSHLLAPPHGTMTTRVLLLSGATCANSAAMAGPSIFAGGKRLQSALNRAGADSLSRRSNVKELHAELCDLKEELRLLRNEWLPVVPKPVGEKAAAAAPPSPTPTAPAAAPDTSKAATTPAAGAGAAPTTAPAVPAAAAAAAAAASAQKDKGKSTRSTETAAPKSAEATPLGGDSNDADDGSRFRALATFGVAAAAVVGGAALFAMVRARTRGLLLFLRDPLPWGCLLPRPKVPAMAMFLQLFSPK